MRTRMEEHASSQQSIKEQKHSLVKKLMSVVGWLVSQGQTPKSSLGNYEKVVDASDSGVVFE